MARYKPNLLQEKYAVRLFLDDDDILKGLNVYN